MSAPAPAVSSHRPVLSMQVDDYLRREYPGYILQNVAGDGSCQIGTLSVGLTNKQDVKYILGRASTKIMLENWQFYGCFHDYDKAYRVGGTDRMFVEEEFKKFLETDESLFLYRDNQDLHAASNMLDIDIDVIKVTNGICAHEQTEIHPNMQNTFRVKQKFDKKKITLLLNTNSEHYQVLVDPRSIEKKETIEKVKEELTNYLNDCIMEEPIELDRIEKLEKRMEAIFQELNKEIQSLKIENKKLCDKFESKTNKDVIVVTESQTSNMEVDNSQDENIQQI